MVDFVSIEVRFCRRHRSNFLRFLFSLLSYCRTSPSTESQTIFTVHWTRLYFVLGKSIESVYRWIEGEDGLRGTKVLHEDFSRCLGKMLSDANFSLLIGDSPVAICIETFSLLLHRKWFFPSNAFQFGENFFTGNFRKKRKLKIIGRENVAQLFNKEEVKTFCAINLFSNNNK